MRNQIKKLNKGDLKELLKMFPQEVLSMPIKKNPKKFSIKGFRPNKIPMKKLLDLYEEDKQYANGILIDYLSEIIKEIFKTRGIEECIDNFTQNNIENYFSLKSIMEQENIDIGIKIIFDLYKIDYDKNVLGALEKGLTKLEDECQSRYEEINEINIKQITEKYEKVMSNLSTEKNRKKEQSKKIEKYEKSVKALETLNIEYEKKNDRLKAEIERLENNIDKIDKNLKKEVKKNMALVEQIEKVKSIEKKLDECNEKLLEELNNSKSLNEKLVGSQFSAECIIASAKNAIKLIEDKKYDDYIIEEYFEENFTEDSTFIDGVEKIQKEKLIIANEIYKKIENEEIEEVDLFEIKKIENYIRMEFVICNALLSTCMEYVAQKLRERDIKDTFLI